MAGNRGSTNKSKRKPSHHKLYDVRLRPLCKYIPVNHVTQESDWDCGISCIKMLLHPDKLIYFNTYKDAIIDFQFENRCSVWTIDLAYILKKLDMNFKYCTSSFGISAELYKHRFYKNIILKDRNRLIKKFTHAKENGIEICKDVISTRELTRHLLVRGPIIVLIDAKWLQCGNNKDEEDRQINDIAESQFQGHYILAIGYNSVSDSIVYMDPSCSHSPCIMTTTRFNKARHASGTDDDIVLILSS